MLLKAWRGWGWRRRRRRRFSTLYRVDAIEGGTPLSVASWPLGCFSTLYRVDAIEGFGVKAKEVGIFSFSTLYRVDAIEGTGSSGATPTKANVSVPSIGSMLLKAKFLEKLLSRLHGFSTLYRVDAIEGGCTMPISQLPPPVSVPSIGSMLLKAELQRSG